MAQSELAENTGDGKEPYCRNRARGGRTRSFQLPADGPCVADGLFPCLYVASLMKGGCQNKNQLLFCHSERSEESQEHKLMHTRYFALLRMTLLFDNQILF